MLLLTYKMIKSDINKSNELILQIVDKYDEDKNEGRLRMMSSAPHNQHTYLKSYKNKVIVKQAHSSNEMCWYNTSQKTSVRK